MPEYTCFVCLSRSDLYYEEKRVSRLVVMGKRVVYVVASGVGSCDDWQGFDHCESGFERIGVGFERKIARWKRLESSGLCELNEKRSKYCNKNGRVSVREDKALV